MADINTMVTHEREEQRQYTRLASPYRVQAKELSFPMSTEMLIDSTCYDISKGGVCVFWSDPLPVGTRLHLEVHIPLLNKYRPGFFKVYENDADQYFSAIGDIAWVREDSGTYMMGINFINSDDTLSQALEKLVNNALLQPE